MNILEWLYQDLKDKAGDSNREEWNRYLNPPKGISIREWFTQLSRAKYGDFISGKYWKQRDDKEEA